MSKNNSILVLNESDFEINTKLDTIIDLLNKQLLNQQKQIDEYRKELENKDIKIERLKEIISEFKLSPSDTNNKIKYNQLIRKKITFPFNPLLSRDYLFTNKLTT